VNSIGQAASVQGHTLFLAEALAAALADGAGERPAR
jgi:hypothetical protein